MAQGYTNTGERIGAIIQAVTVDNNNSSTAQINAGATWTGTSTSTLGVAGIQFNLKADQNCTVYIDQSTDNSNWDITDSYNYWSSSAGFGITVQAVASYYRVRVKNISGTNTTVCRRQACLCPIVDTLPRSLDADGSLKVTTTGMSDAYGFEVENTPIGEMRVVQPIRLVGTQFEGTLDTNFWTAAVANAATVANSSASMVLTSGTNTAGSAKLYSVRRARYIATEANGYRAVIQLGDTGIASNTRKWGVAFGATMPTLTDGAYYQLSGTTFSIVTLKNGSPTAVNSGSFNGTNGLTYTPTTNATVYEIYWTNSRVYFSVGGILLHTVIASASTWADTMSHYVYMDNINSGNSTSVTLTARAATIRRLGGLMAQPSSKYQAGTTGAGGTVCKRVPGNLHELLISGVVNNAVVTLYDNTADSGTILFSSGAMGNNTVPFALDFKGIPFAIGLTLAITGANANATVVFD
jgi:hypothetical protein